MGNRCRLVAIIVAACALLSGCATTSAPQDPSDVQLYLVARLDAAWHATGSEADRPSTSAPTRVMPDGWPYVMNRCMVDAGFSQYNYSPSTGFTNGAQPRSPVGPEGLAWYQCTMEFPEVGDTSATPTEAQMGQLYRYYTTVLQPCLLLAGSAPSASPSLTDFVGSAWGTPAGWNPYLSIATPRTTALVALEFKRCPPYPDAVVAASK